jgi:hypothetical protein
LFFKRQYKHKYDRLLPTDLPFNYYLQEKQVEKYVIKGAVQRKLTGALSDINRKIMTCH